MPTIIVKNAQVHERTINAKNGPAILREQMAAIDRGDGYALPFKIGLGKNPPYPPGNYDFSADSFTLDDYGNPRLDRYYSLVSIDVKPAK